MNDANVAIELQPHFPKAFVRGKSFNSYKTLKSFVSDTTDVWGYQPWTYGIPQGGGGGEEDFWGMANFFWKGTRGDLQKILTDEGGEGGCKFFSPLIKKGSIIFGFFEIKKKAIPITLCSKKVS